MRPGCKPHLRSLWSLADFRGRKQQEMVGPTNSTALGTNNFSGAHQEREGSFLRQGKAKQNKRDRDRKERRSTSDDGSADSAHVGGEKLDQLELDT